MLRTTLTSLLCVVAAASAQAQEGLYSGVLITKTNVSFSANADTNPVTVGFKIGSFISKNFAVEGRVATNLADDSLGIANVKVDNVLGVYGKGILPLSEQVSLYGLMGYTHGKVKANIAGINVGSASDNDVSYGVGADFALTPAMSLNVEYARLFKIDDVKVDGLTLGLSFKF